MLDPANETLIRINADFEKYTDTDPQVALLAA